MAHYTWEEWEREQDRIALSGVNLLLAPVVGMEAVWMQYSIWGPEENSKEDLHEYAHKEWSGLLGSLYYDRWVRFVDREARLLKGEEIAPIDYFSIELAWVNDPAIPATPRITARSLSLGLARTNSPTLGSFAAQLSFYC